MALRLWLVSWPSEAGVSFPLPAIAISSAAVSRSHYSRFPHHVRSHCFCHVGRDPSSKEDVSHGMMITIVSSMDSFSSTHFYRDECGHDSANLSSRCQLQLTIQACRKRKTKSPAVAFFRQGTDAPSGSTQSEAWSSVKAEKTEKQKICVSLRRITAIRR